MSRSDYVPKNDDQLLDWVEKLVAYAAEHHSKWNVGAPDDDFIAQKGKFADALRKTKSKNRGAIDVQEKNDAKKALVKSCRVYVQGFLAKNPNVNNTDKKEMGLPIYDTTPTPVGDPIGLVSATIKYPNDGALELNIKHVEGSPFDKRANYGVKIRCAVLPIDEPSPNSVTMLTESRFTRRKKELFTFEKQDRKKMAYFCLRYENSKGRAGQWSAIISAVIP